MAAEESSLLALLDLFDSYWFEHQIFKKKTISLVLEKHEQVLELGPEPKLSRISTLHVRSFSDQFLSSQESLDFLSPNSVLQTTPAKKLQTILSGKEAGEFQEPEAKQDQEYYNKEEKKVSSERNIRRRRRRKSKGLSSKSLSDLEFEELKGFMDLGFVFSEEDKNSSLVEIIPGLQRFGEEEEEKKKEKEEGTDKEESVEGYLRRPYLSQAWEIMEQREAAENMLKWRININAAVIGNEMDMKDQLKFWAQSVASVVK